MGVLRDLTGQKFGRLTVIKRDGANKHGQVTWLCECECGGSLITTGNSLLSGNTKSCGCLQKEKLKDITGQRFGYLTVIKRFGSTKGKGKMATWLCRCDCGNTSVVVGSRLRSGRIKSCGCWRIECVSEANTKHGACKGGKRLRLYRIWEGMVVRCVNSKSKDFNNYGGRGIKVCGEWKEYEPFRDWALTNGYTDNMEIDRINTDGDYTPENCRWVDDYGNADNRRNTRFWHGVALAEICRKVGIPTTLNGSKTKEYGRIGWYFDRHNGDLPPDIKARYEAYLKESC